uniref:Secreted SPRY domain-containing protein 24 n=1 Tax=Globodera rostochiensis TaxID=31243 RepID=A0A914H6D6_GLORO
MGTVLYLAAICFVVAAIQLKTDASPPETSNENSGLTTDNQWDSDAAACHEDLKLSERQVTPPAKRKKATHSEPKQLVVEHTREYSSSKLLYRSVFAVEQIPKSGIFYYEVKIKMKGCLDVYIGLATKQMELNEGVGPPKDTYAYDSSGIIWGHEVKGCGQVVGCGVNLKNGKIFYTLDGEILIAGLSVDANLPLFPCVTLTNKGQKIEANFGPDFLFKLEKLKNLKLKNLKLKN